MHQLTQRVRGPQKTHRSEARITLNQKRLIERAARLRGTSVTDFVIGTVQKAAAEAIKEHEVIELRGEARDVFVKAMLNPPPATKAARAAIDYYKQYMGL